MAATDTENLDDLSYKVLETRRVDAAKKVHALADRFDARQKEGKKGDEYASEAEMAEYRAAVQAHNELRVASDRARVREDVDERQAISLEYRADQVKRGRTAYGSQGEDRDERRRSARQVVELAERRNRLAMQAWFRCGNAEGELSPEMRGACKALKFNPRGRSLRLKPLSSVEFRKFRSSGGKEPERRDLTVGTPSSGGYLRPEGFLYDLERWMLYYGPMLRVASILRTADGNPMPMPEVDDTSNEGALLAENTTIGSSVDPTFYAPTLSAYKLSSKLIKTPHELLEDSAFDLGGMISEILGERLGRVINRYATLGTGTSQPEGVVTAAAAGKTAAADDEIAFDELINLEFSLDAAYREQGAAFMFNDAILEALSLLKDEANSDRPLIQPSVQEGSPDRLRGKPYYINNHMEDEIAAENVVALFGLFRKQIIRQAGALRFRRLDERFADTDQVGWIAFWRMDSRVRGSGAGVIRKLTMAAAGT